MRALEDIVVPLYCPARAVLFQEQQRATRIFILFDGCAKLSVNSSAGKRVILWIAKPPELLGLGPILSDSLHEVTAETLHRCRVASIPRGEFLDFLTRHPMVWRSLAREVSLEMSRACSRMRTIGLSSVAATRLAMLLLELSSGGRAIGPGICVRVPLTHGEIGECIGTTRETVTRALAELKERQLIEIHGSSFIIASLFALEAYAHSSRPVLLPSVWPSSSRVGHPAVAAIPERGVGDRRIRQA